LRDGEVPKQWRNAKIIPLKKPGKATYTKAKSWRPISLLSTLGKILEAVIAERISYMVEKHGLLPKNHFGARKRRSAEQAVTLLQEQIYKAWRAGRVLSLISFDVQGAYNGVYDERLLQRLRARGIPTDIVNWVRAFCSHRTATIVVNGQTSRPCDLPQAGLPQGSPLSPVLFLFFNADLVQRKIDSNGGSVAFVDDYTAWVTGPTAASNYAGVGRIIDQALEWERRSGATFEADKTAVIHFTRNMVKTDRTRFAIKGREIEPKSSVKVLGLVMDTALRYKEHIRETARKGTAAAMQLRRLGMLPPRTARQLFVSTVAPTMDHACNAWVHACGNKEMSALNKAQKIGAQAITGAFRTVATAVAEAEAAIAPVRERHRQAATRFWINLQTLPKPHPLATLKTRICRRFTSPLQRIAWTHADLRTDRIEMVHEYALPPWSIRIRGRVDTDPEGAAEAANQVEGVVVATACSQRNDLVGIGGVVRDTTRNESGEVVATYHATIGSRQEQNPFTAELSAIEIALRNMPDGMRCREVTVMTSNLAAVQAIQRPRQQSGQCTILTQQGWQSTETRSNSCGYRPKDPTST
jgi:ribonuclease HI